MEVEHSAWLSEYYCSSKCATDRYFNYMESTPVDFENLPAGVEVVGYKLEICPTPPAPDALESAPLNLLSTLEVDSDLGNVPTPTKRR